MPLGAAPPPAAIDIPLPPEPQSIEQTGMHIGFLADLALKTLYLRGQMTLAELASGLVLPITNVVDKVMDFLKVERLVEIRGGTGLSAASWSCPAFVDHLRLCGAEPHRGGPRGQESQALSPGVPGRRGPAVSLERQVPGDDLRRAGHRDRVAPALAQAGRP